MVNTNRKIKRPGNLNNYGVEKLAVLKKSSRVETGDAT